MVEALQKEDGTAFPQVFETGSALKEALLKSPWGKVFVDGAMLQEALELLGSENDVLCYAISDGCDLDALRRMFGAPGVSGVINGAHFGSVSAWKAVMRHVMNREGGRVDIARLVNAQLEMSFVLEKSSERTPVMDSIEQGILRTCLEYGEEVARIYAERAITLSDELMLNAIFDANPEMKRVDRSCSYELNEKNKVLIDFVAGKNAFAISVTDHFGLLKKSDIVSHVCTPNSLGKISDRFSGGLGLRLAVEGSSVAIFEVEENVKTRAILATYMVPSQRQFRANPKSLCFLK